MGYNRAKTGPRTYFRVDRSDTWRRVELLGPQSLRHVWSERVLAGSNTLARLVEVALALPARCSLAGRWRRWSRGSAALARIQRDLSYGTSNCLLLACLFAALSVYGPVNQGPERRGKRLSVMQFTLNRLELGLAPLELLAQSELLLTT